MIRKPGLSVSLSFSRENFLGDMLGLASGIGYGLYLFFSRYRTDVGSDSPFILQFPVRCHRDCYLLHG